MNNAVNERVFQWLTEVRVLDGGFGTECQRRSNLQIDGHMAWSSRLLKEDPELVVEIHKSFLRAGCDVISTNTYQASLTTLDKALGITQEEAENLMRTAVCLARRACKEENNLDNQIEFHRKLPILIAGSLVLMELALLMGQSILDLIHRQAHILLQSGVDFIAWETVPLLIEVSAICEVMRRLSSAYCWISVSSSDGKTTSGGDLLSSVAHEVQKCEQVFGIGVNCNIPHNLIGEALENLTFKNSTECKTTSRKLLLFYANDGRLWMPNDLIGQPACHAQNGGESWLQSTMRWAKRREIQDTDHPQQLTDSYNHPLAHWVGGCCNVGPDHIKRLAKWMKPDEFIVC
ncbi:unnamed protein product [Heterobilharzia americana]|nr:unnamed protein product [Heterobilharzia americana]